MRKKEGSAAVWRCFSNEERAEIPEMLGGLPVTELAPYAFSEHLDEHKLREGALSGKTFFHAGRDRRPEGRAGGPEGREAEGNPSAGYGEEGGPGTVFITAKIWSRSSLPEESWTGAAASLPAVIA